MTKRDRSSTAGSRVYLMGLFVSAGSGATSLAHELLWTRRVVELVGGSSTAIATVLGLFFLGLAIGAFLATYAIVRETRYWRLVARAELGAALLSQPCVFLPYWTDWIWRLTGPEVLVGPFAGLLKWGISAIAVVPPAICMGLVLPALGAALVAGKTNRIGWLYTFNILGGIVGAGMLMGVVHLLGALNSMIAVSFCNVLVASICYGMDALSNSTQSVQSAVPKAKVRERPQRAARSENAIVVLSLTSFVSGFGVISLEVLANTLLELLLPITLFAPAAVLITTLALLGAGAAIVSQEWRPIPRSIESLSWILMAAGCLLVFLPIWFHIFAKQPIEPARNLLLVLLQIVNVAGLSIGPAMLVLGMVFPLTSRLLVATSGTVAARQWGHILAINGLGGLVGGVCAHHFLLPWFGPHVAIGCLGTACSLYALWLKGTKARVGKRSVAVVLISAAVTVVWLPGLPHLNPHLNVKVIAEYFGSDGCVAVIENDRSGRSILLSNQYVLGGTADETRQSRQAHLPLVLHPDPKQVCCIGVATGCTPGAVLNHEAVEELVAVEISPLALRAARQHFADSSNGLFDSSRSTVLNADGRTFMASTRGRFDVVIGDLFLPWSPGAGRMYSLEHFQAVRESLRPGGLFCQWVAAYQLTADQMTVITSTFQAAFGYVELFRIDLAHEKPCVALVGFRDGQIDWNIVARRCEEIRQRSTICDSMMRWDAGIAMLYLGTPSSKSDLRLNTLDNMWIELSAGTERLTGDPGKKYLYSANWLSYVGQGFTCADVVVTEGRSLRAFRDTGNKFTLCRGMNLAGRDTREQRLQILKSIPKELAEELGTTEHPWLLNGIMEH